MGNSYFTIDEGVDKNIATFSRTVDAATVHTQKVAADEPFLESYNVVVTGTVAISTANSHILQIMAGGTFRVSLRRIVIWQVGNANATAKIQLQLLRLTSAGTGGTAYTPARLDPASGAAGCAGMTLPSSKGTESTIIDQWEPLIHATSTTVGVNPILDHYWDIDRVQTPYITAGTSNGLAFKCVPSDSTATLRMVATVTESGY